MFAEEKIIFNGKQWKIQRGRGGRSFLTEFIRKLTYGTSLLLKTHQKFFQLSENTRVYSPIKWGGISRINEKIVPLYNC